MIHHVNIAWLHQVAKDRKPGYLSACFKRGKISGDFLLFTDADYRALRAEFSNGGRASLPASRIFQGASSPNPSASAMPFISSPVPLAVPLSGRA